MPSEPGDGKAQDLLEFNPFADVEDNIPEVVLSTSYRSNGQHHIKHRRRGSGSESSTSTCDSVNSLSGYRGHGQAHTEVLTCSTSSGHPLRSAGLGSIRFNDTRPRLDKIVKVGMLIDTAEVDDVAQNTLEADVVDEKMVVVHEVTPKDSLAGVALKYGISLSELRRANHMWTSDSIHFRKVLYIPLEQALRANSRVPSSAASSPGADSSPDWSVLNTKFSTLRRIPASELSFFPPAKAAQVPVSTQLPSNRRPSHIRHPTAPPHSLTTLLTALPIPPSTRDTIIARLSFDSASSNYSDREDSKLDEGHELDEVGSYKTEERTPRIPHRASKRPSRSPSPTSMFDMHNAVVDVPLRTKQPDPSPEMQLPTQLSSASNRVRNWRRTNVSEED